MECPEVESRVKEPDTHILLIKGPFCPPRSVVKNMTTKAGPKLEMIAENMKSLADRQVGGIQKYIIQGEGLLQTSSRRRKSRSCLWCNWNCKVGGVRIKFQGSGQEVHYNHAAQQTGTEFALQRRG